VVQSIDKTWTLTLAPGTDHPGTHGPISLALRVSGTGEDEIVEWAEPIIYPLHRGAEKLFESRDYRQAMMLASRHDWLCAFGSELGLALTLEEMLGIAVPQRATWIRTLMAELNRVIHHLRWLGTTVAELANPEYPEASGIAIAARDAREQLVDLHEGYSGGRMHPMLLQAGGLRADVEQDWLGSLKSTLDAIVESGIASQLRAQLDQLLDAGIGTLSTEQAIGLATSGPVARASGLSLDLRFDEPYCAYSEVIAAGALRRCTESGGDALARFQVLAGELAESLTCIDYCADRVRQTGGPVTVRIPRSLRVPEGSGYGWTENPTGINGWYLISDGGTSPYRLKLRTASFANSAALARVALGMRVADLPTVMMSFFLVGGDLGK